METKYNEATVNRPEGPRLIEGPIVFTDLVQVSRQLYSEKAWQTNDLNGMTVFKTDRLAMVLTVLKKGTRIKKNIVEGPFTLLVLNGRIEVETDQNTFHLGTAQMLNFQPQVTHSIFAERETVLLQITSQ